MKTLRIFLSLGLVLLLLCLLLLLLFLEFVSQTETLFHAPSSPLGGGRGSSPLGLTSPGVGGRHRGIIFLLLFLCILFHLSNRVDACLLFTIPLKWPGRVTWEVGTRAAGKEARGGDTGWGRGANLPKAPNDPALQPRGAAGHGGDPAWSP